MKLAPVIGQLAGASLIGQNQVVALGVRPVGIGRGGLERLGIRSHAACRPG